MRHAARRFLNDLKRSARPRGPFTFSADAATRACRFIEALPHVEGTWDTATIVMHASHVFATVQLFGFRNRDGTRRFTTVLYAVARKNAKTTWAAGVELYCLVDKDEVGPQVISAATTGDQARIVFNVAHRMVQRTQALRDHFLVEAFANSIACYRNHGSFKPINAKASTQDGLNPSCVGLDEIHAHKTHDLLNVLKSAAGARRSPLFLYTTTEGYENAGPWAELRQFAKQVLEGVLEADHFLAIYYALDDADDEFDEAAWIKANPLIEVNPLLHAEIAKLAIEAKAMPGQHAEFKIKRCNRQSATATGWVDIPKWMKCGGAVDLEALRSVPCWGGLDLNATTDLASLRLVWKLDDLYLTWGRYFCPGEQIKIRTERGTVPYAGWVASGLIEQTEGDVTDYTVIERAVRDVRARFNLRGLAYDPWNARDLVNRLAVDEIVPLLEFVQGFKSYHPTMQELDRAYRAGNLAHGGDPVLLWMAANLVARADENNNLAPSRKRSADKIDGVCALLMAIGAALSEESEESVYNTREMLVL